MKDIRIFNVIDNISIAVSDFDILPEVGDPIEIDHEMYYVCEKECITEEDCDAIGVIPLIVRNPNRIKNIDNYLKCLTLAQRRIKFMNGQKECDLDDCSEIIIS